MKKDNKREFSIKEKSIAIGVVGGTLVGVLTDNIGLWLSLGIAFGVGIGLEADKRKKE
ncbi:MAG: hypothetical protein ABGW83_04610 [Flavobacteriaceae bacterium]|jgi:hypothetical protein